MVDAMWIELSAIRAMRGFVDEWLAQEQMLWRLELALRDANKDRKRQRHRSSLAER
jgi:hypothetical protein